MTEKMCVVPLNDLFDHDDYSENCACKPKVEVINGATLYVHNSFDGREKEERLREIYPHLGTAQ